jgi:hypothetical protein
MIQSSDDDRDGIWNIGLFDFLPPGVVESP